MDSYEDIRFVNLENEIPLVAQPIKAGVNLSDWMAANKSLIDDRLEKCGAILFRGFDVADQQAFAEVVKAVSPKLVEYTFRSTPRTHVGDRIYTATEYPANQTIPLHNESSYQRSWPLRLMFFCLQPAEEGGETPLADSVKVTKRIDPAIQQKFSERDVMYVRNYEPGMDLSWQTVFQTSDKGEVERFCRENGIQCEWKTKDALRTRQICQPMARHLTRGDLVWFNQAHLFHASSLGERTRRALELIYREQDLPRHSYYGDGSRIEDDVLEDIRNAYSAETVIFKWKAGDVLLLDNMLVCHGRTPYKGKRKVLAAMTDQYNSDSMRD
ncbi:MAG: taurine catabolism dioxygenase TauD [Blastocatellia bacterium AA13]|nr:MAG: taurine catabolism dioxygenase TauD [Blastocatellia bacterium AA13]